VASFSLRIRIWPPERETLRWDFLRLTATSWKQMQWATVMWENYAESKYATKKVSSPLWKLLYVKMFLFPCCTKQVTQYRERSQLWKKQETKESPIALSQGLQFGLGYYAKDLLCEASFSLRSRLNEIDGSIFAAFSKLSISTPLESFHTVCSTSHTQRENQTFAVHFLCLTRLHLETRCQVRNSWSFFPLQTKHAYREHAWKQE